MTPQIWVRGDPPGGTPREGPEKAIFGGPRGPPGRGGPRGPSLLSKTYQTDFPAQKLNVERGLVPGKNPIFRVPGDPQNGPLRTPHF